MSRGSCVTCLDKPELAGVALLLPTVARPPTTRALVVYLVPNHVHRRVLPMLIKEEVMERAEL